MILSKLIRLSLFLLLTVVVHTASGQVFLIENGEITTCSGSFYDDGNDPISGEGGPYTAGNDYTFTICPDNPGDVISVDFVAFQLYQSPNPNNSDYLFIFDGDDASAASLGSYTGNDLQGLPVTGTVNNVSGCLTFVFNSNPNGSGGPGWQGTIACTTPCATPTSASQITDPEPIGPDQSIGICLDAPVTFSDIGSFAEPGFNLDLWVWNFDDGTVDTVFTADDITHSFTEPGEYLVSLSVVDDNGCRSLNVDPLQILVSTIPVFNPDFESPVCIGSTATLDGNPVESVTWTALPPQVVAGETFLADGAGFSYESTLTFDFFEPGATLDDCDDFLDVFVNMEHSYLGDLQISLTCPNGTNVVMLPYPNGGGGTFLGEAIDDGSNDPGVGYQYGWEPNLSNGNLDDQTPVAGSVPPGNYQSEEDLCNFVGCPLNGDWTFSVLDNLAIDNGYIFEWGINFNPALFPDITTFTPVIGYGSDSTFWAGPNIVNVSDDANTIDVFFDEVGTYEYTFSSTNNFGCTFDTTVVIEAVVGPDITAGPDLFLCADPATLQASVLGATGECSGAAGSYSYCYDSGDFITETYCPDTPGDGTQIEMTFTGGTLGFFGNTITVYDGDNTGAPVLGNFFNGDVSGQSFVATNPTGCLTFQLNSGGFGGSCAGGFEEAIDISISCDGGSGLVWTWSPADGLSDPNVQNPTVFVSQPTTYTVSAYPLGLPGCLITDQVLVAPDQDVNPGNDTDTTLCYNLPTNLLTSFLGGNPALGGTWIDNATGLEFPSLEFSPTDYPDGGNFDLTYTVSNGLCSNSSNLVITVLPSTNDFCCQTNANAGPDAVACALTYQLQGDIPVGIGTWSGPPEITFSDINDPQATITAPSPGGTYELTFTDFNGTFCEDSDVVQVILADSLEIAVLPEDAICFDECSGTAIAIPTGGTTSTGVYSIEWTGGVPGGVNQLRDSLCLGTYVAKVTDNVGCVDSTFFEIGQPAPIDMSILGRGALCRDSCNARVIISSSDAVEYTYNGGAEWEMDSIGFVCPDTIATIGIRNEFGCELYDSLVLDNPEPFIANFNINPNPTTVKNPLISFQDVSSPGPIAKTLFLYGDPAFDESDSRLSQYRFPTDTAGEYLITLISENVNGCIDTLSKVLVINDDLLWFIPNSFTPNGDGINDLWRPVGTTVDLSSYSCKIYDRWGRLVFQTSNINTAWNGGNTDSEYFSDTDVYTYVLEITSATTEDKYELTGFITLIR
ncbi:gliding motility-associated C-terminal domain-containing protein [Cryomorphaceae bacterium 1068]|nr:gliding motility-associated C-terminal domain-containing protein [Cryomorphaceae bacterium 1068]